MAHVDYDKVAFSTENEHESWKTPSPDRSGVKKKASPGTSRVHRRAAMSTRPVKAGPKGLSRAAVKVVRIDKNNFEVRLKVGDNLIGLVRKSVQRGVGYGYRLTGDRKAHNGFTSQKAAVERMLTKI